MSYSGGYIQNSASWSGAPQYITKKQLSTIIYDNNSTNQLYISTGSDYSPYIGLSNGNIIQLPIAYPNFVISSLNFLDTAEPNNISQLVAYDGELFLNGNPVISTLSTSVLNWSKYPAISDVALNDYSIKDVSSIRATEGLFNSLSTYKLFVKDLSANSVSSINLYNKDTIYSSNLNISTLGGSYGSNLSTTLDSLITASTIGASLWAQYPAVQKVDMSNNELTNCYNVNTQGLYATTNGVTTNSLYVGNDGQLWAGNAQFNKIDSGNYHNFTMDANVTVATSDTISCPNFNGYYSNYYLGVNSIDATGILSGFAHTNAHLNLYTNQSAIYLGTVPFGHAELLSDNYEITFPPIVGTTYDFRSAGIVGSTGPGANAWVRWNNDTTGLVPNTSALLELNADTYFGIGSLLGSGRITQTAGSLQSLATFRNQMITGYAQILQPFSFQNICIIEQNAPTGFTGLPIPGVSSNYTRVITNGGGGDSIAVGLGCETSIAANNWIRQSDSGALGSGIMNIYATDEMYLFTEGDMNIGYYNSNTPQEFGSNRPQKVHLYNLVDIYPTSSGVTNWYGNLDMCNHSIFNVNLNLSTASFSTILTGYLDISNNIYQSNARQTTIDILPYYPFIQTNALQMFNSFSSIQSYISSPYTPTRIQTITDTPHNIYSSDFGYTFYSDFTTTDTVVNIQSGNGTLDFYNNGTTTMHFNFYFSPSITPAILPGASLRIIVSNSNSYITEGIPLAPSTIVSSVSINKTNFYQYMYDTVLSVDISGQTQTSNFSNKGNFYISASTINIGGSNNGGYPLSDEPNYPIKMVYDTQFDNNISVSNVTSTRELDISGNAGGVAMYFNNDTNNLTYKFNDIGTKNIDYDNASFLNTNIITTNGIGANSNSFIFVYDNIEMNYKDLSGVTNLRIGNLIGGSGVGNTNLSNDSNGYFHIHNNSNLTIFDNSINLSNNNIIDVAQIDVDFITVNNNPSITLLNDLNMNYSNISNALSITLSDGSNITSLSNDSNNGGIAKFFTTENQFFFTTNNGNSAIIALDYSGIVETFLSNDSAGNFHLSNGYSNIIFEGTTHQDYISGNCNVNVAFNTSIDLQGFNIYSVAELGADNLYPYNNGFITFNAPVNMNNYDLSGANNISVNNIIPNNSNYTIYTPQNTVLAIDTLSNVRDADRGTVTVINDFTINGNLHVDSITTNSNSAINFNAKPIYDIQSVGFVGGSAIGETIQGGSNWLSLSNQTIVNSNLQIVNGVNNPTIILNNGKQNTISVDSNNVFLFNDNISTNTAIVKNLTSGKSNDLFLANKINVLNTLDLSANNIVNLYTLNVGVGTNATLQLYTDSQFAYLNMNNTGTLYNQQALNQQGKGIFYGDSNNNLHISTFGTNHYVYADTIRFITSSISTSYILANGISTNSLSVNNIENVSSITCGNISTNLLSVYQIENISSLVANVVQASRVSSQTINASTSFFQSFVSTPNTTTNNLNVYQLSAYTDTRIRINNGLLPTTTSLTNGTPTAPWFATYSQSNYGILNNTSTLQVSSITSINANNTINISGFVSAPQMMVSSINNKMVPFWSTLNIPPSSFNITGNTNPYILYSNVQFPYTGMWNLSQRAILSKLTGGNSADLHGSIGWARGQFVSTIGLYDGTSVLPYVNQDNFSSPTTLMTQLYVSSGATTRNIIYTDATLNNYTANLYLDTPVIEYVPSLGYGIDR